MRIILNLLINATIAYVLQRMLDGVHFVDFGTAVIFAVILGLLNIFVKPVLQILSLPLTIFTFGLFSLIINAVIVLLAGAFIDGVVIDGIGYALIFSMLLSILTSIFRISSEDYKIIKKIVSIQNWNNLFLWKNVKK